MKKKLGKLAGICLGNFLLALAVGAFIAPSEVIAGGATGIGLFLNRSFGIDTAVVILAINVLMLILGYFALGRELVLNTLLSSILYPVLLGVIQRIPGIEDLTDNILLMLIYGGVLLGISIGLIMRSGGSSGGLDILSLVLHKWFHVPVAVFVYCVDFIVLGSQALFAEMEQVLFGILLLAIETVLLNQVMVMGKAQIQLFIISEKYEQIRRKIMDDLEAGITMVHIETGHMGEDQKAILCVIPNRKLYAVKEMIQEEDPEAFITISKINEVRGQGFTMARKYKEI